MFNRQLSVVLCAHGTWVGSMNPDEVYAVVQTCSLHSNPGKCILSSTQKAPLISSKSLCIKQSLSSFFLFHSKGLNSNLMHGRPLGYMLSPQEIILFCFLSCWLLIILSSLYLFFCSLVVCLFWLLFVPASGLKENKSLAYFFFDSGEKTKWLSVPNL